ncbi:MAG TPA: DUF2971 domain-containing protein [Microvirga sp.]|jgi:hypothetical protein|nr:DUF2971 domain-containing protein [Microvirga sp.]
MRTPTLLPSKNTPVEVMTSKEALDLHIHLIQYDALGRRFNSEEENIVYHYTDIFAFSEIVRKGNIWASDYRTLNDKTELSFGLSIMEMSLAYRAEIPDLEEDLRSEVLEELALARRGGGLGLYVFSASFCKKGNVLSQWRAYGRQDGIAIGFSRQYLEEKAAAGGFVTGPVFYYFEEGHNASALIKSRLPALRSQLKTQESVDVPKEFQQEIRDFGRTRIIRRWLAETAAFIKHPAFAEEVEWRCVLVADTHPTVDPSNGRPLPEVKT